MGIHHLSVNNTEITALPDIANTLGHTFLSNSSSQQHTDRFNAYRREAEKEQFKYKSNNFEVYNSLFSLEELKIAIESLLTLL